jgi:hypothetical protein
MARRDSVRGSTRGRLATAGEKGQGGFGVWRLLVAPEPILNFWVALVDPSEPRIPPTCRHT